MSLCICFFFLSLTFYRPKFGTLCLLKLKTQTLRGTFYVPISHLLFKADH